MLLTLINKRIQESGRPVMKTATATEIILNSTGFKRLHE